MSNPIFLLYSFIFTFWQALRTLIFSILAILQLAPKSFPATVHSVSNNTAILVTGASTGIGHDIALKLLQRGYTVFAGIRKQRDADTLQQKAKGLSGCLITVHLDVKLESSIRDTVDLVNTWRISNPYNMFLGLVNNAGVTEGLPMELLPMETVEDVVDTNFLGVVRMVKAFLPLLRECRGRIVNIGSMNGTIGIPFMSTYSASKFALEGWTDAVRREISDQNIQISLVKPGSISTPIFGKTRKSSKNIMAGLDDSEREIADRYYHEFLGISEQLMQSVFKRGLPSTFVTLSVLNALESPFPQTRYLVGIDSVGLSFLAYYFHAIYSTNF